MENKAKTVEEYTVFMQGIKKEFEKTGIPAYFRRTANGNTMFLTVAANNKLDRIERNEITDSLELPDSDVILTWVSGGWERV